MAEKGQVFHTLRNTFIACMEGHGVPESTCKLLVGHARESMTYRALLERRARGPPQRNGQVGLWCGDYGGYSPQPERRLAAPDTSDGYTLRRRTDALHRPTRCGQTFSRCVQASRVLLFLDGNLLPVLMRLARHWLSSGQRPACRLLLASRIVLLLHARSGHAGSSCWHTRERPSRESHYQSELHSPSQRRCRLTHCEARGRGLS